MSSSDEPLVEWVDEVAGLYFRSVLLLNEGQVVTQHTHDYDHATYIGNGSVRLFVEGNVVGDFPAGRAVKVSANQKHHFVALEPNTRLTCVHIVERAEAIKRIPLSQYR